MNYARRSDTRGEAATQGAPGLVREMAGMISQAKKFRELAEALNSLASVPTPLDEADNARVRAVLARTKDAIAALEES